MTQCSPAVKRTIKDQLKTMRLDLVRMCSLLRCKCRMWPQSNRQEMDQHRLRHSSLPLACRPFGYGEALSLHGSGKVTRVYSLCAMDYRTRALYVDALVATAWAHISFSEPYRQKRKYVWQILKGMKSPCGTNAMAMATNSLCGGMRYPQIEPDAVVRVPKVKMRKQGRDRPFSA